VKLARHFSFARRFCGRIKVNHCHFAAVTTPSALRSMLIDAIGSLAAGLVLATFCMRSMSKLRLTALASNLAFIAYGYLDNLMPVLVLHALLLPVNAWRLVQLFCAQLLHEGGSSSG
jgi:hypothetical protein